MSVPGVEEGSDAVAPRACPAIPGRAAPDGFSTDIQLCQNTLNLVKFIFLIASVFYNGAFNLFFLCLLGFLLSGTCRPPLFPRWK